MKIKGNNSNVSIGIHFNGHSFKGVCLKFKDGGAEITAAEEVGYAGVLPDEEAVLSLQELMKKLVAPPGCSVYATTGFEQFFTTHLSVGDAPVVQMNKMARLAYQQEIHPDPDNTIFDYERVGETQDAATPRISLHAFSVERAKVDALCEVIKLAGYKPAGVFPPLFASRNLITVQRPEKPVAVLALDKNELRIGVIHDGKYTFTRTFKSGQDAFLEYISQKVGEPVSLEMLATALTEKEGEAPSQLSMEIETAFSYIAERMRHQIDRAFKFYSGRLKLPALGKMLLFGDSPAITEGFAKQMEPHYPFPVSKLCFQELDGLETGVVFLMEENDPEFILAAGAGLAAKEPCPNLLFTHSIQQQQRKAYRIRTALMLSISTLALICLSTFAVQMALLTPRMINKRRLTQEAEAHPVLLTKEILEAKVLQSQKRLMDLHNLAKHYSLQGYYFEVARLIPPQLKIEHMKLELYEKRDENTNAIGQLEVRGVVTEEGLRQRAYLTKFIVEMGGSPAFKNIEEAKLKEFEKASYREQGLLPFRIVCDLSYGGKDEESEG